jgi:hypothetical protein
MVMIGVTLLALPCRFGALCANRPGRTLRYEWRVNLQPNPRVIPPRNPSAQSQESV